MTIHKNTNELRREGFHRIELAEIESLGCRNEAAAKYYSESDFAYWISSDGEIVACTLNSTVEQEWDVASFIEIWNEYIEDDDMDE